MVKFEPCQTSQCLKWRIPVVTSATPYLLQHSMASWSRMLPPGCAMAFTPALHAISTESFHANGKNASLAITDPCTHTHTHIADWAGAQVFPSHRGAASKADKQQRCCAAETDTNPCRLCKATSAHALADMMAKSALHTIAYMLCLFAQINSAQAWLYKSGIWHDVPRAVKQQGNQPACCRKSCQPCLTHRPGPSIKYKGMTISGQVLNSKLHTLYTVACWFIQA